MQVGEGDAADIEDEDDDDDMKMLTRTFFTFQKKAESKSEEEEPRKERQPPPLLPLSPPKRQTKPLITKFEKKYQPKHSFDRLILDSSGPLSVLADEEFWKDLRRTSNPQNKESDKSDWEGSSNENLESKFSILLEESLLFECADDNGISFFENTTTPSSSQRIPPSPSLSLSSVSPTTTNDNNSLVRVVGILAGIGKGTKFFFPLFILTSIDIVEVEEAKNLLLEGVLKDLCQVHLKKSPQLITRYLVGLLKDTFKENLQVNIAVFQLLKRSICICDGQTVQTEELWTKWNLANYLSGLDRREDIVIFKQLLDLHRLVLNVCSAWISIESIKETFLLAIRLSMDLTLYRECWRELSGVFSSILEWLDVPRLCLLTDWIHTSDGSTIFDHYKRPIRLARLLNGSDLGQVAGKILLDCALFPLLEDFKSTNDEYVVTDWGNDLKFIITLRRSLESLSIKTLDGSKIASLQPKLSLATARLYLTFLDEADDKYGEEEYKKEVKLLLKSSSLSQAAIPPSHFPAFINNRDLLSRMMTYLRSYLLQHKSNRSIIISSLVTKDSNLGPVI